MVGEVKEGHWDGLSKKLLDVLLNSTLPLTVFWFLWSYLGIGKFLFSDLPARWVEVGWLRFLMAGFCAVMVYMVIKGFLFDLRDLVMPPKVVVQKENVEYKNCEIVD
jgi:hypothetical protein